jgi:CLN3 protein
MPRKVEITKPPKKSESKALAATTNGDTNEATSEVKDRQLWRDLVAYWILGMCNNYGYVVMLTAAHDIIKELGGGGTVIKCEISNPTMPICGGK